MKKFKRTKYWFRRLIFSKLLTCLSSIIILFLLSAVQLSAESYVQSKKLTISKTSQSLMKIFNEIEENSEFHFFYDNDEIDVTRKVSISVYNSTIEEILDIIFKDSETRYETNDRYILLSKEKRAITDKKIEVKESDQQFKAISGKVNDAYGESLPGVTVVIKGTSKGTITDIDGKFTLNIDSPESAILQFSFVGMISQEISVGNKSFIEVTLEESTITLEEVVAVGYGVQKKATVTGSISSISNEKLIQTPVANVSNALAGRMPGLLSVQREGEPGRNEATLRIRGEGTFSGSSSPLVMVDGVESLNFNNIDPHEIEDITILKDASATAVFGVRGANGVILITTKRGKDGKPVLSWSSNVAIKTFTELRENLGSYEYAINFNEALKYNSYFTGSYTPKFSEEDIEHYRTGDDPIFYPDTDWFSLMLKPASFQTHHNVNIRGGSKLIKYFVSAGYFSEEGLYKNFNSVIDHNPNVEFKRYNLRSNFDFQITKRLSSKISLSSQIENKRGPSTANNTQDLFNRISLAPPYHTPGIVDNKMVNVHEVFKGNPLEQLLSTGYSRNFSNYITSTVSFDYVLDYITKGLKAKGMVSYWNRMNNNKRYNVSAQIYKPLRLPDDEIFYEPQKKTEPVQFSESTGKNRKTYFEVGIEYDRTFGNHGFTGLLLYNQSKLHDPNLAYVIPNGYQGLVGRVTYDYKRRYLAEFNAGYNGTENFAPSKRFGFFPAYSLGWVLSEEPFFPENNIVSYVKLRGAYGEVGNDKIGGSRFLYLPSVYQFYHGYNLGVPGSTFQWYNASYEGQIGNPDLTWERAKKTNLGVDINLFNNKIRLVLDYFNEERDDILATPQTTPEIVGANLPPQNWGKMRNRGFESEINFTDRISDLNYWAQGTFTFAKNKILFQDEVFRKDAPYMHRTGQSKGQMFGYIADGFYNTWEEVNDVNRPASSHQNNKIMPGDVRYKDINGDGVIDAFDQVPIGYSSFPEIIYGFSFGADYKGLDFSVLFQGATRVSRRNYETTIRPFENDLFALSYIPKWSWTQEKYEKGETIKLPHLNAQQQQSHDYQSSTFMIQDASYLRLKNAEIGYSFDTKLLKQFNISSLRFYLNGNNLFTWHGLFPGDDPEQFSMSGDNGYYPLTRTFNIGVNIQF